MAITARLQKELETERMKILPDKVQKEVLAVSLDEDILAKQARKLAWNEYKAKSSYEFDAYDDFADTTKS